MRTAGKHRRTATQWRRWTIDVRASLSGGERVKKTVLSRGTGHSQLACSVLFLGMLLSACAAGPEDQPDGSGGATLTGGASSGSGGASASGGGSSSGGAATSSGGQQVAETVFGGPCTKDEDCPAAPGELLSYCGIGPSGYCTATCSFSIDNPMCGAGAVCDVGRCLKFCITDADCREGYYCQGKSKGCERDPRP